MEKKIKHIVDDLILYSKDGPLTEGSKSYLGDPNSEDYPAKLSDYIYRNFYASIKDRKVADQGEVFLLQQDQFTKLLIDSIGDQESTMDEGWVVKEKDKSSNVYVQKGQIAQLLLAGAYLNNSTSPIPVDIGLSVRKYQRFYSYEPGSYFFYAHGKTVGEYTNNFIVRYYFNISPEGMPQLLECICSLFNKFQIPFELKCPSHPSFFDRKDSCVLYLNKRFASYVLPLMQRIHRNSSHHLESETPFFTKEILPGIGFAESPPKNAVSFGMSRCDLIAEALQQCLIESKNQEGWYAYVLDHLQQRGFDTKAFFLNPNNHYPYASPISN